MESRKRLRARTVLLSFGLLGGAGVLAGQIATGCVDTGGQCGLTFDFDGCKGALLHTTGGGGGTGGTTSASTTGGSGGGTTGCTDAGSCPPAPPGPCASLGKAVCTNGKCRVTYTAGPAPSQKYGSCQRNVCDTNGVMTSTEDDSNVFDDGNPCIPYACSMGMLTGGPPGTPGASCMRSGNAPGYCEPDPFSGILSCEECNPSDQTTCSAFPGTKCVMGGKCVPGHCTNGLKDGGETDVDCGGGGCLPCSVMATCSTYKDCASLVCMPSTGGVCVAPTCTDGRQNGTETDIDCGGLMCPRCGDGLGCSSPKDCISKVCKPMGGSDVCQSPSCTDGVQNGDEMGVDCGGTKSMCPPC